MVKPIFSELAAKHMLRNNISESDMVGGIFTALNEADPDDTIQQLHNSYLHGGGWNEFEGFTFNANNKTLDYAGDPPQRLVAEADFRGGKVMLFESAWVAVLHADGTLNVARMD